MKMPFIAFILQGIPENIAVLTLSLTIVGIELRWGKIVVAGTLIAFVIYLLRALPISFGVHTIVALLLFIVFTTKIGEIDNLRISIMASLLSILALTTIEIISLTLLTSILGISEQEFISNTAIRILLTLPQVFILFLLAFIIKKVRRSRCVS